MTRSLMDVYIETNTMDEGSVKSLYGVSKKNALKVLKTLVIAELKNETSGVEAAAKKARKPRKPRAGKGSEKKAEG